MKRKMFTIVIMIIAAVFLFLAGWYILFWYAGIGPAFPFSPKASAKALPIEMTDVADDQLYALAETEEEARHIADLYGITLVSFSNGVALYHTDEDLSEVLSRGKKYGYPALSINHIMYLDEK